MGNKKFPYLERDKIMLFYEEKVKFFLYFFFFVERRFGVAGLERDFQAKLIKELKQRFEGCIVMKNDSSYIQGIPDLLVLYNDRWASLECKKSSKASKRPNQQYYVDKMNDMSFSRFICPENKQEVLDELERAFKS